MFKEIDAENDEIVYQRDLIVYLKCLNEGPLEDRKVKFYQRTSWWYLLQHILANLNWLLNYKEIILRKCGSFLFQLEHFFNQLEENGDKVLNLKQFKASAIQLQRQMKTSEIKKWKIAKAMIGADASNWGKRVEKVPGQWQRGIFFFLKK